MDKTRYLDEYMLGQVSKKPLICISKDGEGKTSLLKNWSHQRQRNKRRDFVFFHSFDQENQLKVCLKRLLRQYNEHFQTHISIPMQNNEEEDLLSSFATALQQCKRKNCMMFVFDSFHLCIGENGAKHYRWLPISPLPNLRIILSISATYIGPDINSYSSQTVSEVGGPNARVVESLINRGCPLLRIESLVTKQRQAIVRGLLPPSIFNKYHRLIVNASGSKNMRFIYLILGFIRCELQYSLDDRASIINSALDKTSTKDLLNFMLDNWLDNSNTGIGDLLKLCGRAIICSRRGLSDETLFKFIKHVEGKLLENEIDETLFKRVQDMMDALGFMKDQETQIRCQPSAAVIEDFSKRFCVPMTKQSTLCSLANFFKAYPSSMERCFELLWLLKECGQYRTLAVELANMETFRLMMSSDEMKKELMEYWWYLIPHGIDPVVEYNKQIEANFSTLSISDLHSFVLDIASFLWLLGDCLNSPDSNEHFPQFNHPQLSIDSVTSIVPSVIRASSASNMEVPIKAWKGNSDNNLYFWKRFLWVNWLLIGSSQNVLSTRNEEKSEPKMKTLFPKTQKSFWLVKRIDPNKFATKPKREWRTVQDDSIGKYGLSGALDVEERSVETEHTPSSSSNVIQKTRKQLSRFFSKGMTIQDLNRISQEVVDKADGRSDDEPKKTIESPIKRRQRAEASVKVGEVERRNLPSHLQQYPVGEREQTLAVALTMVAQLRRDFDNLCLSRHERERELQQLQDSSRDRTREDESSLNLISDGASMIANLEDRLAHLKDAHNRAKSFSTTLESIARINSLYPASTDGELNKVNKQAEIARLEVESYQTKLNDELFSLKAWRHTNRPRLLKAIERNRKMHNIFVNRLRMKKQTQEKEMAEENASYQNRLNIVKQFKGTEKSKPKQSTKQSVARLASVLRPNTADQRKDRLSKCEEAFERIKHATSIAKPQEFVSKFLARMAASDHLNEQKRTFEQKLLTLTQLKTKLDEELDVISCDVISSRRLRELDDEIFVSELALKHRRDRCVDALNQVKNAKAGVIHLATRLALPSHEVSAVINTMPSLNDDDTQESGVSQVLSLCAQRLLQIQDNLSASRKKRNRHNHASLFGRRGSANISYTKTEPDFPVTVPQRLIYVRSEADRLDTMCVESDDNSEPDVSHERHKLKKKPYSDRHKLKKKKKKQIKKSLHNK